MDWSQTTGNAYHLEGADRVYLVLQPSPYIVVDARGLDFFTSWREPSGEMMGQTWHDSFFIDPHSDLSASMALFTAPPGHSQGVYADNGPLPCQQHVSARPLLDHVLQQLLSIQQQQRNAGEVLPWWCFSPRSEQVGSPAGSSFPFRDNQQYHHSPFPFGHQPPIPPQYTSPHQPSTSRLTAPPTCARQQCVRRPPCLQLRAPHRLNMSLPNETANDEDELAQLQKLSNEYEPEVKGPLVGPRVPSTAITAEYLSADPVFQAKTAALPQKYSHYRTMRGDGRCGWRAVAFGYFETLIRLRDAHKCAEEEARLQSLNNVLNAAGFSEILYEDFAEEAYTLLRSLREKFELGEDANATIEEAFNDETIQNYLITYLKTLTAAWMKTHEEEYIPYLLDASVHSYCDQHVMPLTSEIDDVSLNALRTVFLAPAKIALEVVYLDRSEADEANTHHFDPSSDIIGTVRLLYRPGHYDILYKATDAVSTTAPVVTYLQFSSHLPNEPICDLGMSDFMTAIPGMSYASPQPLQSGYGYAGGQSYPMPGTAQRSLSMNSLSTISTSAANDPGLSECVQAPSMPTLLPASQNLNPRPAVEHGAQPIAGPFRKSAWELEPEFATSQVPFKTTVMLNSPYNTAHFLNPDFQPDQWQPDDDYVVNSQPGKSGARSFRHRFSA